MKSILHLRQFGLVFSLTCAGLVGNTDVSIANYTKPNTGIRFVPPPPPPGPPPSNRIRGGAAPARFVLPPPPPGPPPGGRIRGGARRDNCPAANPPLTALVTFTEEEQGIKQIDSSVTNVWGLTTMEYPTLWFYVPFAKDSAYPIEFVLLDEESNTIYSTAIAPPDMPGVIAVSIPTTVAPLAVGKRYRWFFNMYCDQQKQLPPVYVEGVIQRVNLSQTITDELQTAQPKQQFAIYANNGIWYDALTILAELRQTNPQDETLDADWENLLEAIGLGDIATKPLL